MRRWLAILTFGLLALGARAVTYTPYYQSQAVGNDSNNGLTPATAWKTFHPYNLGSAGITGPAIIYIDGTNAYNGHTSSSYRGTYLNLTGASNADVILTNWGPGHWAITNCLAGDAPALQMKGVNWVRIFGMDVSNGVNQAIYLNACTNLEFGFCEVSSNAAAPVCYAWDSSGNDSAPVQLVYVHDCDFSNVLGSLAQSCGGDPSSDLWHVGQAFNALDHTGGFIFLRNTFVKDGHAGIESSGPSNRITGNNFVNFPWQVMNNMLNCTNAYSATSGWSITNANIYMGGRQLGVGGRCSSNNLVESNGFHLQGWSLDQPAGDHHEMDTAGIDRFNVIEGASGLGLFYDVEAVTSGGTGGGNAIYHDSIGLCGSNQTWYGGGQPVTVPYPVYQAALGFAGPSGGSGPPANVLIDCIFHHNYSDTITIFGSMNTLALCVQDLRGVLTNANPLWVSEANSVGTLLPNPVVYPNFALASAASPALSSYTWPGVITSTGTGTTFQSTNAYMFSAGQTACYFTMPGDTIQTQAGQVATILSISGNTVTVSAPLTVTSGMGYDIAGANASGAFALAYGTALVIQAASLGSGNFAHP